MAPTCGGDSTGSVLDRSGKREPNLEDTLPRLLSAKEFKDVVDPPSPLDRRSGLVFGLALFFVFKASLNLPTGEGDRF